MITITCKACNTHVIKVHKKDFEQPLKQIAGFYNIICDECIKILITQNKFKYRGSNENEKT